MPIAKQIKDVMSNKNSSVIRKMFEEGISLKAKYGEDNVFDFSLGNPDMTPPEEVRKAVLEVAADTSENSRSPFYIDPESNEDEPVDDYELISIIEIKFLISQ